MSDRNYRLAQDGEVFCSGGLDNKVCIWSLQTPQVQLAVKASYATLPADRTGFKTYAQQIPLFCTTKAHNSYVDSVAIYGDLLRQAH